MPAPVASGWSESPGGPCTHLSGHWCQAEIFSIADCIFAEVVTGGMINGHSRLQQTAASAPGGLGSVIAAKTASTYLRFGHRDRDHNPAFSGRGGRTVGPIWKAAMSQVGARSHTDPGRRRSEAAAVLGDPFMTRRS